MTSPDQDRETPTGESGTRGVTLPAMPGGLKITTVVITLLIILRIFSLAQWDWEVAGAIIATIDLSDIPSVIISTVYTEPLISSIIVAAAGPLVVLFALRDLRTRQRVSLGLVVLIALLIAAGLSLVITFRSWWMIVVVVAVLGGGIAALNPGAPPKVRRVGNLIVSQAVVGCVVLELFVAAFSSTPWIERESIALDSGEVVDGYVLEVESGFVKVLDEDRQVRVILAGDIASRTIL